MPLLVIAEITAKSGAENDLKAAFHELIPTVRQEEGCLFYELFQSTETPTKFIMHELWTDAAGLQAHSQMPHMAAFGAKAKDWLAAPTKLTKHEQ